MYRLGQISPEVIKFAPGAVGKATGSELAQWGTQAGAVLYGAAHPASLLALPGLKVLMGGLAPADPFKNCFDATSGENVGKVLRAHGKECWEVFPNTVDNDYVGDRTGQYFDKNELIRGYNAGYLNKSAIDRFNRNALTQQITSADLAREYDTPGDVSSTQDKKKMKGIINSLKYLH